MIQDTQSGWIFAIIFVILFFIIVYFITMNNKNMYVAKSNTPPQDETFDVNQRLDTIISQRIDTIKQALDNNTTLTIDDIVSTYINHVNNRLNIDVESELANLNLRSSIKTSIQNKLPQQYRQKYCEYGGQYYGDGSLNLNICENAWNDCSYWGKVSCAFLILAEVGVAVAFG